MDWISIHAPSRGATSSLMICVFFVLIFQSTHPQGVRRLATGKNTASDFISIHAPSRGATDYSYVKLWMLLFQSTHPQGVRPRLTTRNTTPQIFQSTHPQGVRPGLVVWVIMYKRQFQSTHPQGVRRHDVAGSCFPVKISIHAPSRGATVTTSLKVAEVFISIHAPSRGAT